MVATVFKYHLPFFWIVLNATEAKCIYGDWKAQKMYTGDLELASNYGVLWYKEGLDLYLPNDTITLNSESSLLYLSLHPTCDLHNMWILIFRARIPH